MPEKIDKGKKVIKYPTGNKKEKVIEPIKRKREKYLYFSPSFYDLADFWIASLALIFALMLRLKFVFSIHK